jgi:arylsulfatase A-like enzyme
MGRRGFLRLTGAAGAAALLLPVSAWSAEIQTPKPNIVVMLADDLGYAGLSCQGCRDIPTPHIDSLAANGVRFTNGYANHPVCSPSRAGLLAGRYQHRFGFEHNSGPERFAAENFGLPRSELALAERLKAAGYATGMVGKWHVGFKEGLRPHERGFDFHYGFLSGARTYLPGNPDVDPLLRNGQPVTDEREYLTDAFARESVAFIERNKDKPFFLYVAFNAVHGPMEATREYEARFPAITDPKRRTHAGMVAAMDDAVGRVLTALRQQQLEENTLIFFYSDNGGPTPQTTASNAPLRGYKGQLLEGGIRVPFLMQWKGHVPGGTVYPHMVMGFDVHATALAAAGVPLPADKPLDGVDLLPFLTGATVGIPHDRLFWRAGQQKAARLGEWKLVVTRGGASELYNLREDIGEVNNLAAREPARLADLQAAYAAWETQMIPAQWVRQDGRTAGRRGREAGPDAPAAGRGAGRVEELFRAADKDGDGKLSAAEYPQPGVFKEVDANADGAVILDEVRAYYRGRRQQRGGQP